MHGKASEWVHRLTQAHERLVRMSGTQSIAGEILDLTQRISTGRRVVSVFGAFSAGKSSLINALLEQQVLVVSPNPTTASVTQLEYGEEGVPTAFVVVKNRDELWEDVSSAIHDLHLEADDLDTALQLAGTIRMSEVPNVARRALMFLKGVQSGYSEMFEKLGDTLPLSWEEAKRFTADERYACFVKRVDARCPASFLSDGLCLVDTPGVDSVNQRHTHVAFDYMRKADAIVFVIYYTHAFSRADKDFLLQLAGVQDVVGQDKLFVVINAVDLATSDEERVAVRQRVETELRQFGLRGTRIFEVSSQLSYAAHRLAMEPGDETMAELVRRRLQVPDHAALPSPTEISKQAGVDVFRQSLLTFVEQRSDELLSDAASRVWNTTTNWLSHRLTRLEQEADADQAQLTANKERRKASLNLLEDFATLADSGLAVPESVSMLSAEAQELAFHATERIRFRLPGLIREAFHPGRFIQEGQAKKRLQEAAEELAAWLNRQWAVECRTMSLRLGVQAANIMDASVAKWSATLQDAGLGDYGTAKGPISSDETQDRVLARASVSSDITWALFQKGFTHFSSSAQFFERGGQKAMIEEYETVVRPWLQSAQSTYATAVSDGIRDLIGSELAQWARTVLANAAQAAEETDTSKSKRNAEDIRGVLAWFRGESQGV